MPNTSAVTSHCILKYSSPIKYILLGHRALAVSISIAAWDLTPRRVTSADDQADEHFRASGFGAAVPTHESKTALRRQCWVSADDALWQSVIS
jgi:hypothetical protein